MNRRQIRRKLQSWWQLFQQSLEKHHQLLHTLSRIPEVLAGAFVILSSILSYLYGCLLILPEVLGPGLALLLLQLLSTWVLFGILANYYLMHKRSSSIRHRILIPPMMMELAPPPSPSTPYTELEVKLAAKQLSEQFTLIPAPKDNTENWLYCTICQAFVPPRTWHCSICQTCILRSDHHCIFIGCCIGETNQSNFIGLVLYLALGTSITTTFSLIYFLYMKDYSLWYFLFRSLVLIYTFWYDFDVVPILTSISMMGVMNAWGMFAYYMFTALTGKIKKPADPLSQGPLLQRVSWKNMEDFLGPEPVKRILWPFHPPRRINYGGPAVYKKYEDYV